MALSESPTATELKEVAAQYPDVEITRQDSLDAGNCESGTDDFIEANFKGKTITVNDLVPYIEDYNGVQAVLAYKFRPTGSRGEIGGIIPSILQQESSMHRRGWLFPMIY